MIGRGITFLQLTATTLTLLACGIGMPRPSSAPVQEHKLHGVVESIDQKARTATIKHDEIQGFMGAMTMEYPVRDPKDLRALRTGETIDGKVFVQDSDFWLGDVHEGK